MNKKQYYKLPQLTVYAKILYLLMVLIVGALCDKKQVNLYTKCTHRFVGITPDGRVFADNGPELQNITISDHVPPGELTTGPLKLSLYIEKANMFICFTSQWRLVPLKTLQNSCYFYETLEGGWYQYRSAEDETKLIGFKNNGKPVQYRNSRSPLARDCFQFLRLEPKKDRQDVNNSPKHHGYKMSQQLHSQRHHHNHQQQHHRQKQEQQHHQQQQQKQQQKQQHHQHQQHQTIPPTKKKVSETSKAEKTKLFQKKHALRKQSMNNSRRFLLAKNPEKRRAMEEESRIKELDFSNEEYRRSSPTEYSNITKKTIVSKKVTNINSGIGLKFRHGKNHRRKIIGEKLN